MYFGTVPSRRQALKLAILRGRDQRRFKRSSYGFMKSDFILGIGFVKGGSLSMSEIKSEHSDGVIRRELESEECARWPEQPVGPAHPCSGKGVFSRRCNRPYKKGGGDADAARRRRRHGQDIPDGSSQSAAPYVRSAMASVARWAGPNAHGAKPPGENFAIDRVAIADDVPSAPAPARLDGALARSHTLLQTRPTHRKFRTAAHQSWSDATAAVA